MGWNRIDRADDIDTLMDYFGGFHDSCLKEARYVSGSYVDGELAMYPYDDKRELCLLLQRQARDPAVIELVFEGVDCFHLESAPDGFDSCILNAYFQWSGEKLWWSNWGDFDPDAPQYGQQFTWVSALSARWRVRDQWLGEKVVYEQP